jgi:FHS family L-fucose permease-like MFS transporter
MVEAKSSNMKAIMIIGMLFFIFGFVTWLNGTLIPFLKLACQLHNDIQAFFVTFAFYMAYFFLALPSAMILKKTGFKNGMALGLFVMAIGSIIFIPAAQSRTFGLFLTGLFVQGAGLALLQTASNPYISIIGPVESAAKRISIMGICNKGAGALSPLIVGSIVLKNAASIESQIKSATNAVQKEALLNELASRVITPYTIMAAILILLAFIIRKSSLPDINTDGDTSSAEQQSAKTSVFQYPHLLLGMLCIFFGVGAEVMAGDAITIFGKTIGISLDQTKYFTTFTLIAMLFGYVVGIIAIPKYISQQKALAVTAVVGMVLSLCVYFTSGYTSVTFIALMGLANALTWPAIFPLAINGLGKFTKTGSGMLIMGIAGGATIPLVYGILKDKVLLPNNLSFLLCTLPCFVYIFFYAVKGYKAGKEKTVNIKALQTT